MFEEERTLERLRPKIELLGDLLAGVESMPEVREVRRCGFMTGIELQPASAGDRMGHRVTIEARRRGAIVRPLGDTVVLMPPLAIAPGELRRLVAITAAAIEAVAGARVLPRAA